MLSRGEPLLRKKPKLDWVNGLANKVVISRAVDILSVIHRKQQVHWNWQRPFGGVSIMSYANADSAGEWN